MSRFVGGFLSMLEDVGAGAVALVTAVLASAVGVVATMHVTGGTPYSQDDLDRASQIAEAQAPAAAPAPAAEASEPDPDALADAQELEDALERVERLQRQSDDWEDKWTTASGRVEKLREQLAELRETQAGAVGPDGLPLDGGTGGTGDAGGTGEPGATEVTASGTLLTSWVLSEARKPWPARCGVPEDAYAVKVLGPDGASVATGSVTGSNMVKRTVKGGVLSLVCELRYEAVVPLPPVGAYEFQAVAADRPQLPLFAAVVPGSVVATGAAPRLSVSYCPDCG